MSSSLAPRACILRLVVATLACMILAEVGLRVAARLTGRTRGVTLDEHLGWHMLPKLVKTGGVWGDGAPARTNSHGWRDAEHPYEKPHGVRRILVLGDSFVFGQNVDYGQRFTELLERPGLEVVNMGACAFGPDQELVAYEREGRRYGADTVVWVLFLGNDLDDSLTDVKSGWSKPVFRLRSGELLREPPRHDLWMRLRARSYLAEGVLQLAQRGQPANRRAPDADRVDRVALLAAIAEELARQVAGDGARLLVALAHPPGDGPSSVAETVHGALRGLGLEVVDLYAVVNGDERGGAAGFLPCGHWSPAAHARVAAALEPLLER